MYCNSEYKAIIGVSDRNSGVIAKYEVGVNKVSAMYTTFKHRIDDQS